MRDHYDFLDTKGRRNPYVNLLKQSVTIRLDKETIGYFKSLSKNSGIPYQTLINLYLRDCAVNERKLSIHWKSEPRRKPGTVKK